MREIKFRGKRIDNGQWVEGYYFKTPLTDEATGSKPEDGWYFLTGGERDCISKNNCVYEVNPKTIGQYTGLKDKNSIEIYEGDIIETEVRNKHWRDYHSKYQIDYYNGAFYVSEELLIDLFEHYNVTVIGNIYDNPELI
jgi:uncharacterized phage protein (TIGR01671 family)